MRNAKTFNAEVKVKASDLLTVINGLDSTLSKMHEGLGEYDADEYSDIENAIARLLAEIADNSDDLCYFPLNKLIEAELLCEELNQARGHLKGKL